MHSFCSQDNLGHVLFVDKFTFTHFNLLQPISTNTNKKFQSFSTSTHFYQLLLISFKIISTLLHFRLLQQTFTHFNSLKSTSIFIYPLTPPKKNQLLLSILTYFTHLSVPIYQRKEHALNYDKKKKNTSINIQDVTSNHHRLLWTS